MDEMNAASPPSRRTGAFTLIELMIVIAIASLMMVMAVPALHTLLAGTNLDRAGQQLGDAILRARQEAVSRNREVDVLFYDFSSGGPRGWCGVQSFRIDQTAAGSTSTPLGRLLVVPTGIIISASPTLSPLLAADSSLQGSTNLPAYGEAGTAGFRYRADGTVANPVTTANNFLTLQSVTATGSPPANYYTIQVNPITGKVTLFRP